MEGRYRKGMPQNSKMLNEFKPRMKRLEETFILLDPHCRSIFVYLNMIHPKEQSFNKMHEELRSLKKETSLGISSFSSPNTLSNHLKHLLEKQFIVFREDDDEGKKKSLPYKYYKLSPYFREIAEDTNVFKALDVDTPLKELKKLNIEYATKSLAYITYLDVLQMFKMTIEYPDKLSKLSRMIMFYHWENIMMAFRKRVLDSKEEKKAIEQIKKLWEATYETKEKLKKEMEDSGYKF